jgi:hypothetical protein
MIEASDRKVFFSGGFGSKGAAEKRFHHKNSGKAHKE